MPSGSGSLSCEVLATLDCDRLVAVTQLVAAESGWLGDEPLSDTARILLHATQPPSTPMPTWHGLVWRESQVVGYVQLRVEGQGWEAEIASSRAAAETDVLARLVTQMRQRCGGPFLLWARGDQDPAASVARELHMQPARTLLRMQAAIASEAGAARPAVGTAPGSPPALLPESPRALPPGLRLRTFRVGLDEDDWLAANREAFVNLPDQGGWVRADLMARIAEPWFRPEGFFLIVTSADEIAGFHWTKIHPGADCGSDTACGEIYVLGVSPRFQGRGLGGRLTDIGLDYFRSLGVSTAMLYVDASNAAAVNTYVGRGFSVVRTYRQFAMP